MIDTPEVIETSAQLTAILALVGYRGRKIKPAGPYSGLGGAWRELRDWIAAEGWTPAPNQRSGAQN